MCKCSCSDEEKTIKDFINRNISGYVGDERDTEVSVIAERIMATNVKQQDAYHVASAIYAGCAYFITTDVRLLKFQTDEIKLVNPIEFITEMED